MSDSADDPNGTYWRSLDDGRFRFQRCRACANPWLPARSECPKCWSPDWDWEDAGGGGRVVSWVVFHTAFHEAFEQRLPYNVAVVELEEGPRLITNLTNLPDAPDDVTDKPVRLVIERDMERALPRFRLA